ncbi:MAG: ferrous iron transport protein B, partial [Candidatus Electrothrix sp. MAN1_4]|nr:ferrous iron transport protein B [Candidatus Electrothrix sp. MAN1_4]
ELVARDYLVNEQPDVVVNIVDASNLERNLYLSCQFIELGVPLVLALNMIDVAEKRGIHIDTEKLSELIRVPVIPLVARSGQGVEKLLETVQTVSRAGAPLRTQLRYGADIDQALREIVPIVEKYKLLVDSYPARWTALKVLENDEQVVAKVMLENVEVGQQLVDRSETLARHLQDTIEAYPETVIADHRYGFVRSVLRQGEVTRITEQERLYASDQIDKVVTNRIAGPLLMAAVLFGLYSFTFDWSLFLVDGLGIFFEMLGSLAETFLPDGPLKSMVISGVIDGVGGVLGFVPIIMFMFFGIAVLEDSGYLARVAFMMDRVFHFFGLHGSSVMPFILSGGIAGGCAVPGVMAARTLRSPKERMATLLTVPFMNCGAKLPVLTLIVAAFFPMHQARYMFLATLVAWLVALMVAKFLRMTLLRGESTPFVMELPPYRVPTLKGLLIHTWERTWQYIKKAGTVILGISILLWAMMTYPGLPSDEVAEFDAMRQQAAVSFDKAAEAAELLRIDQLEAEAGLRHSIAGRLGMALEPLSHFAGFDWRTNIALVGGFAAKEVIVSTLGTAYSLGEVNTAETTSLTDRLASDKHWNPIAGLAFLFFIMFYSPCFVTVIAIAKEAGSWKWAFFSMGFNTFLAFTMAVGIFQLGTLLM